MLIQTTRREFLTASAVAIGSVILPHGNAHAAAAKIEVLERHAARAHSQSQLAE